MIRIIKKGFKMTGIILGSLVLLLIVVGTLFVNLSPQFGGKVSKERKAEYASAANYKEEKFVNQAEVQLNMSFKDMMKSIKGYFGPMPNTTPEKAIHVEKVDSLTIAQPSQETQYVWFGHSSFFLKMKGKNILLDPMFSEVPAPHPMLGGKRFSKELPIAIQQLPKIDAVIISHDHYDHLDYESIKALKDKVTAFYVPLGVGAHLEEWGVDKALITELNWWEEAPLDDLTLRSTPAQHFSGRGLFDRADTLWCSWIIESDAEKIFFSGDSGYGEHFKEIGEKYGPFDFAMMECGQYNEMWSEIHMFPEETVQAAIDVKAKSMMPIHWGAFKLAMHSWKDPIERVTKTAKELAMPIITPQIGEVMNIVPQPLNNHQWWSSY